MSLEIRSVRIKNCGPIDDIKIDFFDASGRTLPVCVIGGANGSGKTSVLEVITSLLELWVYQKPSAFLKGNLENRPEFYIQLDIQTPSINKASLYAGNVAAAEVAPEKFGYWQGTSDGTDQLVEIARTIKFLEGIVFEGRRGNTYPVVIYLPHNRSLEPVTGTQINKENTLYRFVNKFETVHQFPSSLNSYLIWLDYAQPEKCQEVLGFLNRLDFDGKTFSIKKIDLDVIVKTKTGHEHKLHELSSGEQNLLIILIELHRRLIPGSVVLIDEIENSLHPAYQHRLAQGLLALQKEIPYQLIVTTHAPAFVEIFGAENTRLLTPF